MIMDDKAVLHILRKAAISEEEKVTLADLRKKMPPCPICGRKAYLDHSIVDGFDFGYDAGCPEYCLDDGIHGISDCYDPKAPHFNSWSPKLAFCQWYEYCERMKHNAKETAD